MITHNFTQGSDSWHSHRASHFNASDCPAMMGVSAYTTRSQLLSRLHSGVEPEVDEFTQRKFDDGHTFEALARPLAEQIIDDDLYPVVGSDGELSASYDGLTMSNKKGFEHKSLNESLRAVMVDGCTGADLPPMYRIQMEQQCMVAGCESILFMASTWAKTNKSTPHFVEYDDGVIQYYELVEKRECTYLPDLELRQQIIDGWRQFAEDLANYKAPEVMEAKPIGKTPETLPALHIEVTGMVTASNLNAYKEHALAVFAGINRELTTDAHFADAEKVVKWCGDVEDRLQAAKQHALSQTSSIDQLFRAIDDISAEAKRTRLELDKLVKARKETIRGEIVAEGIAQASKHMQSLNDRLGRSLMPPVHADFGGVIKGKRSVDSIREAVSNELARVKIESNAIADRIQININTLNKAPDYAFLFADIATLVLKASDDLEAVIQNRISAHQAKEASRIEADRARIAEEERIKAEAAAKARADAEAAASRPAPQVQSASVADDYARVVSIVTTHEVEKIAIPAGAYPISMFPAKKIAMTAPDLKLGQIAERLGFALTADFLSRLGFEPAAKVKNATLYHESDFPSICDALVEHIQSVCEVV